MFLYIWLRFWVSCLMAVWHCSMYRLTCVSTIWYNINVNKPNQWLKYPHVCHDSSLAAWLHPWSRGQEFKSRFDVLFVTAASSQIYTQPEVLHPNESLTGAEYVSLGESHHILISQVTKISWRISSSRILTEFESQIDSSLELIWDSNWFESRLNVMGTRD